MAEQFPKIDDVYALMDDEQLSQFDGKTVFKAVTEVVADQIQDLIDTTYQLLTEKSIDTAIGAQLDVLGRIVGRSRGGYSDIEYRSLLKLQVGINISTGAPSSLVPIIKTITNSTQVDLHEDYPAAVSAVVNGDNVGSELLTELEATGCAGVDLSIRAIGGDDAFGFEGSSNALGYGSIHDSNLGGRYTAFIEV